MPRYEADLMPDEDGELVAKCPECEGSGKGEAVEFDPTCMDDMIDDASRAYCPVCCGFGRLDW